MTELRSGIYRGWVRHRRNEPKSHAFRYRLYMMYVDLDELDELFRGRWFWSVERRNVVSFHRADYLGDPAVPLADAVRDEVERATGARPHGAVRMLTQLRCFGYAFNPVTFYYCFGSGPNADRLDAVVAEITNTPWGERHRYVVSREAMAEAGTRAGRSLRSGFDKDFHVSPFMPMEQRYDWVFSPPDERLVVHMRNFAPGREPAGQPAFDATLHLERREPTAGAFAAALVRHPWMTGKVIVGIYLQALRLWLKRIPFHVHPRTAVAASAGGRSSEPSRQLPEP